MKDHHIDPMTGKALPTPDGAPLQCSPEAALLRKRLGATSSSGVGAVMQGGQAARHAGQGWLSRNKLWVAAGVLFTYVLLSRALIDGEV